MDQQKRSVMSVIRMPITLGWLVVSTVVYGAFCMIRGRTSRNGAWIVASAWVRHLLFFAGVTVKAEGLENLDINRKYIFVGNHQSYFDILALFAAVSHRIAFIAKKQLFDIPFFGWGMKAMGHISMDRDNIRQGLAAIKKAAVAVNNQPYSLVIFPEGTRSSTGVIGKFKQASFALPIEAGIAIAPFAILDSRNVLPKDDIVIRQGTITVRFGKPIDIAALPSQERSAVCQKVYEEVCRLKGQEM